MQNRIIVLHLLGLLFYCHLHLYHLFESRSPFGYLLYPGFFVTLSICANSNYHFCSICEIEHEKSHWLFAFVGFAIVLTCKIWFVIIWSIKLYSLVCAQRYTYHLFESLAPFWNLLYPGFLSLFRYLPEHYLSPFRVTITFLQSAVSVVTFSLWARAMLITFSSHYHLSVICCIRVFSTFSLCANSYYILHYHLYHLCMCPELYLSLFRATITFVRFVILKMQNRIVALHASGLWFYWLVKFGLPLSEI